MRLNRTLFVVNAAGKGSRLGKGMPKCLVQISGLTLLERLLRWLPTETEVVVVVGYQAESVIRELERIGYRGGIVINPEYEVTQTMSSLSLGARRYQDDGYTHLVSVDGDLVVRDDKPFPDTDHETWIGVLKPSTCFPVYVRTEDGKAIEFCAEKQQLEWSGLCRFPFSFLGGGKYRGHVKDFLKFFLPIPTVQVDVREVDTPRDLEAATAWVGASANE